MTSRRTVLGAILSLSLATTLRADDPKPRIAVLEFVDKTDHSYSWYSVGRSVQDMLITELVKSGKYTVLDRERLAALMSEKSLSLSGDLDPKTAIKAGRLLGVEYFVAGAATQLMTKQTGASSSFGLPFSVKTRTLEAAFDARAINTTTGEIVWADSASDSSSDTSVFVRGAGGGVDASRKLDQVLRPIVGKLATSLGQKKLATGGLGGGSDASGVAGKVAKADGGTIYLNVGAEAGLKEGDEFDVFRMGEIIKDPDSGDVLGQNETKVGRIRVTAIRGPRLSTAAAIGGTDFKPGDVLKK